MLTRSTSVATTVKQTASATQSRLCRQQIRCVATQAEYKWKIPPTQKAYETVPPERVEVEGLKGKFAMRPKKGVRELRIENDFHVKVFRLCNTQAGNPITASLMRKLSEELAISNKAYDPTRLIVLINDVAEGQERTFSVGDSVGSDAEAYYRAQYLLLNDLHNSRPVLSILDGKTTDGGAGLALSTLFTMATNTSAMSVRGTNTLHINGSVLSALTRLDEPMAKYLALAAPTLTGADLYHSGLSNIYVPYERLGRLRDRLSDLASFDPLHINASLCEFMQLPTGLPSFAPHLATISRCFDTTYTTVEDIIIALEKETDNRPFAEKTLAQIKSQPGLALKIALRQVQTVFGNREEWDRQTVLQNAFQVAVATAKSGATHAGSSLEAITDDIVKQYTRQSSSTLDLPAPVPWSVRQTTEVLSVDDVAAKFMPAQYQPKYEDAPQQEKLQQKPGYKRKGRKETSGDPQFGIITGDEVMALIAQNTITTEHDLYQYFAESGRLQVPGNAALLAQHSKLLMNRQLDAMPDMW
eukprot:comp21615_c0_seq1/m.30305 comp21615_c0_seq1/g.30305  ORF comp21615_c0_seq1/g.30305 comp21615_c0_seq1/m.30305 type:complete len:528 (-) comp21615_c0_seq1:25-1608(-)